MDMNAYETEHLELLRKELAGCTVLLRSDGSFPLDGPCEIALFGSGARHTVKGGTGSGEVNSRFFITAEEGLEQAGFTVTSKKWLDYYDAMREKASRHFLRRIKNQARKNRTLAIIESMGEEMAEPEYYFPLEGRGDTALYVVRRISGEGSDRPEHDLRLTDTEIRDILTLNVRYRKFMLVLNTGGVIDLSPLKNVRNILLLSQLGVETGAVLADILLGNSYPSGKLSATWASLDDYNSDTEFGNRDDTRYKEGIYVGYRWFDSTGGKPLFPFGFGLGYTEFEISGVSYYAEGETVHADCTVTNTGSFRGRETMQLYVSSPGTEYDQPYQQLAAFAKSDELEPQQKQILHLSFLMRDLSVYDEKKCAYVLSEGDYILRLGTSSRDTEVIGAVHLRASVTVQRAVRAVEEPDFADFVPQRREPQVISDCIEMNPDVFETKQLKLYEETIDRQLAELNDDDLIYTNIGSFKKAGGVTDIVGSAARSVAGAAGETTAKAASAGFPVLVMADGPAGLRLSTRFIKDRKGNSYTVGLNLSENMVKLLPKPAVKVMKLFSAKPKKNAVIYEQYTTALPIATAIAQSWDLSFAKTCGDLVAEEMEYFHVDLWLAPALNIQRDIRCGRNYEYFSEDPLLSGLMAAAITKAVQAYPGCGVTLKHFAANNQETNRYNSNSVLSERALREIYLRGFEIAIRECEPYALMTSYNLINGIHTSQHKGLLIDILRRQFGYRGIVMTDWVTAGGLFSKNAKYPVPDAALCSAASGDLFMPGSAKEFRQIRRGLKNGTVTRKQLLENASRVKRVASEMKQMK